MALSMLPASGSYLCTPLRAVHWGPGSVSSLPTIIRSLVSSYDKNAQPKAMIITGKSLLEKTPVIGDVRHMLEKEGMFGGVFSEIGQHARKLRSFMCQSYLTIVHEVPKLSNRSKLPKAWLKITRSTYSSPSEEALPSTVPKFVHFYPGLRMHSNDL